MSRKNGLTEFIFCQAVLLYSSLFEKSFPQSVRPTLREISPEFGCRSPLRRPHPGEISHKL